MKITWLDIKDVVNFGIERFFESALVIVFFASLIFFRS